MPVSVLPMVLRRVPAVLAAAGLLLAGCASSPAAGPVKKDGPLHHYQLGRMYYEQGRVSDALTEIERSLKMDSSLPQVWFYRGYIYWNQSKWKEAETSFRKALEKNGYYTDARMWLATCLDQEGDVAGALEQLDLAAQDRSFPTPEKIHLTRASVLERARRDDEALAELRTAVGEKPRLYEAHYRMALVLARLGKLGEASMAFDTAEPGFIHDAEFHLSRGEVLLRLGRRDDASRELHRTMEIAPGSEWAAKANTLLKEIG
jgi:tetratricopeptide (TPR) repeat protein